MVDTTMVADTLDTMSTALQSAQDSINNAYWDSLYYASEEITDSGAMAMDSLGVYMPREANIGPALMWMCLIILYFAAALVPFIFALVRNNVYVKQTMRLLGLREEHQKKARSYRTPTAINIVTIAVSALGFLFTFMIDGLLMQSIFLVLWVVGLVLVVRSAVLVPQIRSQIAGGRPSFMNLKRVRLLYRLVLPLIFFVLLFVLPALCVALRVQTNVADIEESRQQQAEFAPTVYATAVEDTIEVNMQDSVSAVPFDSVCAPDSVQTVKDKLNK